MEPAHSSACWPTHRPTRCAKIHRGSLADLDSLKSGAAQSDAVIHTAVHSSAGNPKSLGSLPISITPPISKGVGVDGASSNDWYNEAPLQGGVWDADTQAKLRML
jgi:hypothetical protein